MVASYIAIAIVYYSNMEAHYELQTCVAYLLLMLRAMAMVHICNHLTSNKYIDINKHYGIQQSFL